MTMIISGVYVAVRLEIITGIECQVEYHKVLHGSEILTGAKYTYDNRGNIVKIQESVSPFTTIAEYSYDSRNQLIQETYDGDTYTYTYDTAGNILSESKNGSVTRTYSYNDSRWHDKLTAVNAVPITYDAIGNPDTYQSGSGGSWTLSWENGRQLASVERSATSGTLLTEEKYSNEYDLDGIRSKKVSVVTKYNINSGSGGGSRPRCCNYTENTKRNVLTKPLFVGKINILITLDQQGD